MPFYHRLGDVPPKRHTVFPKEGGGIHYEHLMGNLGFTGLQSLMYTRRRPTSVVDSRCLETLAWESDPDPTLRMRHLRTHRLELARSGAVTGRHPLLFNADVAMSLARPGGDPEPLYRNAQGDEIVFVGQGAGVLESQYGELDVRAGDYVVIPRGIIHRWRLEPASKPILFITESRGHVRTPSRYRNEHGQLLEHSPFCERDIRPPSRLVTVDEARETPVLVKKQNALHEVVLDHHPFDTVGWDGYYFPWALSIHDFEPITGRLHQPPPVHQTFQGNGWVLCSFVPRLYDYHPQAVPAPYNHSNVMSDEVIYYCNDEFMSRKGIEFGSLTLHPDGLPHGPQPGRTEASIGQKETNELAVMVDTFAPLRVALAALPCEDDTYQRSWLGED
ncbi:MAG: homogentisate 1,2-dioxygenase [Candidatus Krumholzibacteriia bacterium]